jgi:3-polyprenyl-4-hydroxybenzoate decarboxylase
MLATLARMRIAPTSGPRQGPRLEELAHFCYSDRTFRLGFFIDKACIVSRDPDDWNNEDLETVGIYRLQVKGKNRLGIQPVPVHDIAIHLDHAEQLGQDLSIAIAVGNEPIIPVAASMSVSEWTWALDGCRWANGR